MTCGFCDSALFVVVVVVVVAVVVVVCAVLSTFAKLRKETIRFVMSVHLFIRSSAWSNLAPTDCQEI